jgi:integrase
MEVNLMPRRRKVNIRLFKKETDGEKWRRHRACPWRLLWRDPETGKQVTRWVDNEIVARKLAVAIEEKINLGVAFTSFEPVIPLKPAIDQFLNKPGLAASTVYVYKTDLTKFGDLTGWPNSTQWTPAIIQLFIKSRMAEKKISKATVNKNLSSIESFMNWSKAVYNTPNPFDRLPHGQKRLRTEKRVREIWTPEQFETMLSYLNPQWRLLALMSVTGVGRRKSLMAIKIQDIDFENHTIKIKETKTGKEKLAPMIARLENELVKYISELPAGSVKIFTLKFHQGTWRAACEKAKLPHIPLHHMRTCGITWLIELGVSDIIASKILDHSDPSVTRKFYTQLNDLKVRREGVNKLPISSS